MIVCLVSTLPEHLTQQQTRNDCFETIYKQYAKVVSQDKVIQISCMCFSYFVYAIAIGYHAPSLKYKSYKSWFVFVAHTSALAITATVYQAPVPHQKWHWQLCPCWFSKWSFCPPCQLDQDIGWRSLNGLTRINI